MRPNGGWSSSGTQNMQSSTGQYSTHAGEPAHPVQHSVITASSLGFFLRGVAIPFERGSCFSASDTNPSALATLGSFGMAPAYGLASIRQCANLGSAIEYIRSNSSPERTRV